MSIEQDPIATPIEEAVPDYVVRWRRVLESGIQSIDTTASDTIPWVKYSNESDLEG